MEQRHLSSRQSKSETLLGALKAAAGYLHLWIFRPGFTGQCIGEQNPHSRLETNGNVFRCVRD